MPSPTRETLTSLPTSYFQAVDTNNVDGVLAHFTQNATLAMQTTRDTFTGIEEIRGMFSGYFASLQGRRVSHVVTSAVVDEGRGKVATQVDYYGEGGKTLMHHCCVFFDVGVDGRLTRVVVWIA